MVTSTAERQRLLVEVACRQEAARRLLVHALTQPDRDPALCVWAAWVQLERSAPFVQLLIGESVCGLCRRG
jgi:hypothetical protein